MNLSEKLNEKSVQIADKNKLVEDEIVNWFKERFESENFAKMLEANMTEDNLRDRKRKYKVEFWDYSDGCSGTHFSCCLLRWENPETTDGWYSRYYKGVTLYDIHRNVCARIMDLAKYYLRDLGLNVLCVNDKETWLKYYDKEILINW